MARFLTLARFQRGCAGCILDAPIALDLLGCSGKALQDDIATVVAALKKIGASFIVFPISCIEMQHNLRSMLALPPEQRRG
jgi:hypothetical protein